MPIELITALDGDGEIQTDANTFADIAFADAYFDLRPNSSAWTDLTDDDDKARLLLWAMRSLNGLAWIGGRLTETQPLDWPRVAIRPNERTFAGLQYGGGYGAGLYDGQGFFWASNTIPTGVKNAQCEYALAAQLSTTLSLPSEFKTKIVKNSNGTLEWNLGKDVQSITVLAQRELRGLLLHGAGMSQIARA